MGSNQVLKGFFLICILAALINKWLLLGVSVAGLIIFIISKVELWEIIRAYRNKRNRE
ncbi:hypothetical protein [Paenibacillus sp. XY044]|uniref:hypothetical protein n=1 Tax=Paenibacillus sp. XY044 TaxID=2026089 RepID=UPI0015C5EB20|nr:hypothetical protein [Paenibacillus sp. XY044]